MSNAIDLNPLFLLAQAPVVEITLFIEVSFLHFTEILWKGKEGKHTSLERIAQWKKINKYQHQINKQKQTKHKHTQKQTNKIYLQSNNFLLLLVKKPEQLLKVKIVQ